MGGSVMRTFAVAVASCKMCKLALSVTIFCCPHVSWVVLRKHKIWLFLAPKRPQIPLALGYSIHAPSWEPLAHIYEMRFQGGGFSVTKEDTSSGEYCLSIMTTEPANC